MNPTTALRRLLAAAWFALAVSTFALVAVSHLAPVIGYRIVIVGGASMSPSIPIGSLLAERSPSPDGVVAGAVVTMAMPNGAVVTHRVTRVLAVDGETLLETRGDANAEPDPALVPASAVTGVVAFWVPLAGVALAFIGLPTGAASLLGTLVALLFAIWLLERDGPARRVPLSAPGGMIDGT